MLIRTACAAAVLLGLKSPALAEACRLALVLALDVSGSVTAGEDRLQREGLAAALLSSDVRRAFVSGGPVALYVFQWSDVTNQEPVLPGWQLIENESDLVRVAQGIAQSRCERGFYLDPPTAIGAALARSSYVLSNGPNCSRRVINISTDGESNSWLEPRVVYETRPFDGVTVNALLITEPGSSLEAMDRLGRTILHGPGAFAVLADGYEDYQRAMRIKLLRELEAPMLSGSLGAETRG
jgi:hypothetical protein